ncbi:UDP binding domain-containing protein [Kitasatospora sp. NPDC047058]|uniref:UDP binding domain-containing protein n=1 Tax=Kitasatospora sp. NPDC047058 TaxID=3155620 RepID=UPI00340315A2
MDLARELVGGSFEGRRIAVRGAAFKPESDDIRDSPALDVAAAIGTQGGTVAVYDPAALDNARKAYPELGYATSATEAARGAHAVLLLTEWREFAALTPGPLDPLVAARNLVDGRNVLDPAAWRAAGWNYRSLGCR